MSYVWDDINFIAMIILFALQIHFYEKARSKSLAQIEKMEGTELRVYLFYMSFIEPWKTRHHWAGIVQIFLVALILISAVLSW